MLVWIGSFVIKINDDLFFAFLICCVFLNRVTHFTQTNLQSLSEVEQNALRDWQEQDLSLGRLSCSTLLWDSKLLVIPILLGCISPHKQTRGENASGISGLKSLGSHMDLFKNSIFSKHFCVVSVDICSTDFLFSHFVSVFMNLLLISRFLCPFAATNTDATPYNATGIPKPTGDPWKADREHKRPGEEKTSLLLISLYLMMTG